MRITAVSETEGIISCHTTGWFNLAYMRHTGKWHELFTGQTLDECLASIRDDPWFQP